MKPLQTALPIKKPSGGKNLTSAEIADRRAKGLCFHCDEPFSPEHSIQHKGMQFNVLELDECEDQLDTDDLLEECQLEVQSEFMISVNALTGIPNFRTMRITGQYNKKSLHILVDSGSTHNFLDINLAKRIGCKIESMDCLSVTVADGGKIQIASKVKNFNWKLQNIVFQSDVMLLPLDCCDLVLGVEWLVTLGDII